MRLSITTDELSLDLNSALEILNEAQCREFELRALGLETIPDVDERWLALADKAVLKRLRVTSLAPRLFFDAFPSKEEVEKTIGLAKRLKCNLISVYSTQEEGEPVEPDDDDDGDDEDAEDPVVLPSDEALDALRAFIVLAAKENIAVALRTHPDTCAGSAREVLAIVEELGSVAGDKNSRIGIDWDIANCFASGDDSGLESLPDVLPHLKIVRMRDAIRKGLGADWAALGKGVIPWEDILELLYEGGYRGPVVLEPAVAPKLKEGRAALALAGRWIGACRIKAKGGERGGDRERDEDY
jgi:sugar phosphate isomerase/epimerase